MTRLFLVLLTLLFSLMGSATGEHSDFRRFFPAAKTTAPTVDRVRQVAQQGYEYAVQNPRVPGLNRMQLGKDAEVQATRWMRRWAERNGVDLGPGGLQSRSRLHRLTDFQSLVALFRQRPGMDREIGPCFLFAHVLGLRSIDDGGGDLPSSNETVALE